MMTAEEFKERALEAGVAEAAVERGIEMHNKFIRMGMQPASYEEMLAAIRKSSCVEVFESSLKS